MCFHGHAQMTGRVGGSGDRVFRGITVTAWSQRAVLRMSGSVLSVADLCRLLPSRGHLER